jgi:hypothetical protein
MEISPLSFTDRSPLDKSPGGRRDFSFEKAVRSRSNPPGKSRRAFRQHEYWDDNSSLSSSSTSLSEHKASSSCGGIFDRLYEEVRYMVVLELD